ncbi:MAG: hypothetical protein ACJAYE_002527 [Candidatus Azotimanducaceae bacterium]|jgi:hypothetical protein
MADIRCHRVNAADWSQQIIRRLGDKLDQCGLRCSQLKSMSLHVYIPTKFAIKKGAMRPLFYLLC